MEPVDLNTAADACAAAPLLNCLLREVADAEGAGVHRLRGSGRILRVGGGRRPSDPALRTADGWQSLSHAELVKLTSDELRQYTGVSNDELPSEIADSRAAVAALLAARAAADAPEDLYLRSEQALVMGHPHHPAPKARGGAPAASWLPYAPEAHARFPLVMLGLREDQVAEEGGPAAADAVDALAGILDGPRPPAGYRALPAHPWQLELLAGRPGVLEAFADGRLLRLGPTRLPVWPTASIRTVHAPGPDADLFAKFSLDVRITNDVRRLWRHDLLKLCRTDAAVEAAFADLRGRTGSGAVWLADRGYRTASFAFEELAVLVRDGLRTRVAEGATPLLAAALAEDFREVPSRRRPTPCAGGGRTCVTSYLRCCTCSPGTGSCWRPTCRTVSSRSTPTACRCRPSSATRRG